MFLVDGSNHAFRVQFALPPQHASDGFPTRLLYGFTLLFQKMMRTYRPDYCVVSFDSGKTFRHEVFPDYKGHRPDMPDDMRRQWRWLPELVEGFGYSCLAAEGYEADDVLGTLARRFAGPDLDVYIVTSDKDFCQLVNEHIFLLDDVKGQVIKPEDVQPKLGVAAEQVVDLLGLSGDSSDNIPGVPGIGLKTAAKLLDQYGDLESVLAAAQRGEIRGKRGENLVTHAEAARLSAHLATIRTDLELDVSLEDLAPRGVQEAPLRELFDQWEFGMVARKLLPEARVVDADGYRAITEADGLRELLAEAKRVGRVGVSARFTHDDPARADLLGLSLAWDEQQVYVPLQPHPEVRYDLVEARQEVLSFLADPTVEKVGYDLKPLLRVCRSLGSDLRGIAGDVRLLDYVLTAHRRTHALDAIAQRHLGHTMAYVPTTEPFSLDETVGFAVEPAHVAHLLHRRLERRLEEGPRFVYEHIERPLMPVLADMETTGIRLDRDVLGTILDDISTRMAGAEKRCHEIAGRPFNVGSTKDVAEILFEELGLPAGKRTKTGYSTDSSVLEKLAELHELPAAILDWRQLQKLESTYLRKLPGYVGADGRVHTTFQQAVAATGRLSSTDPNLQNIPIRTYEGRRIRDAFVAEEGHVLLSCDYSQVELRVLAHFCGGGPLVESFARGEDIHRRTASEVFGVPIDEITPAQRNAAKAINFGLLYGMSAFRLSRDLSIPRAEAERYMEEYFGRIPQVQEWIEATKEACRREGYVETLFGRRRLIPEIHSKTFSERSAGEREAVNTRVQGTAADIIKLAMISVHEALAERFPRARLLLQVHDELLLEVPEDEVEAVRDVVVERMMSAAELKVPLVVNSAWGRNWNQAHG